MGHHRGGGCGRGYPPPRVGTFFLFFGGTKNQVLGA